ncbi:MAG: 30S ribosomal protein S6 [candidate division KSB1 bacterium]|nr:30S ribosomal protein S6 [candidate division KSB1 bacterium]MDZ7318377.1 30S ribosomal protein S6 [candidate division KSB1 bacterium]MDZ7341010.1 30S ribosomal protein S6 [candidate division KSB1 bacterium]
MRTYQTIVVIDSLIKAEEIDAIIEKITRNINNNGGKILVVNRWEKKRLAYEIKKRQYGFYVEIVFEAPSNLVKILERDYRLDEHILRYLTVHLDKRALKQREQEQKKPAEDLPEIPEIEEILEVAENEEVDGDSEKMDVDFIDEPAAAETEKTEPNV